MKLAGPYLPLILCIDCNWMKKNTGGGGEEKNGYLLKQIRIFIG